MASHLEGVSQVPTIIFMPNKLRMDQKFICNTDVYCGIVCNGEIIENHLNLHLEGFLK